MSEEAIKQDEDRYERNRSNPPKPRDLDPEFVKHYNRGWKASGRLDAVMPLEAAYSRGEPDAWHCGYADRAFENKKWVRVPDEARLENWITT